MALSAAFFAWVTRLRLAWMGPTAQKLWGAFATVLGDRNAFRAERAVLESYPEYAEDPSSIALAASARQLEQGVNESLEEFQTRLTKAPLYWALAGTEKGLLLQLYLAGYPDAVLIQQNGISYCLDTPAADLLDTEVIKGEGPELIAPFTSHVNPARTPIPAGEPWYTFDGDIEHCSRFAVLLPTQPVWWRHQGRAVFDGTQAVADVAWSQPLPSTPYYMMLGPPESDDFAPLLAQPGTVTEGAVAAPDETFVGTVGALAWVDGENPYCCPSDAALAALRRQIHLWRPAKALCVGIYALVTGRFFDYPTMTFDETAAATLPNESVVVSFAAE